MKNDDTEIRRNFDELKGELQEDAVDVLAYLSFRTGGAEVCLDVLVPYAWPSRGRLLCGVSASSDCADGLSTLGRDIFRELGWQFNSSFDAADYFSFSSRKISAHRRLLGVRRIRQQISKSGISPP